MSREDSAMVKALNESKGEEALQMVLRIPYHMSDQISTRCTPQGP